MFSRFSSVGMVSERVGHDLATERQVNHTFYEENYLSKKIIEKNSILVFFFFLQISLMSGLKEGI